jgi:hypothetical protein
MTVSKQIARLDALSGRLTCQGTRAMRLFLPWKMAAELKMLYLSAT